MEVVFHFDCGWRVLTEVVQCCERFERVKAILIGSDGTHACLCQTNLEDPVVQINNLFCDSKAHLIVGIERLYPFEEELGDCVDTAPLNSIA